MAFTKLPLAMKHLDEVTCQDRGYELQPTTIPYDAEKQIGWTTQMMGKTSPTTYSTIGSTGFKYINDDTDEGADDQGTD